MDEMELLLAEARSIADDILASVEEAAEAESPADAKEAVQGALRLGEEMMDRLEEALDFAVSEADQARIDTALTHLEDALDSGQVALTSGELGAHLENMRIKTEEALYHLSLGEGVEE